MPYAHTTWGMLKTQLARRLEDTSNVFWADAELGRYLAEALRVFGALSGFWRERAAFSTVASTAFYRLDAQANFAGLLDFVVTDRDLVTVIQDHFLEPATGSSWTGTDMFTLELVSSALQRRRDQFLAETGIVQTRSTVSVNPVPSNGRVALADTIINVRRAAWQDGVSVLYELWPEDEFALSAGSASWAAAPVGAVLPRYFSILAPPPLEFQLAPIPSAVGTLDLVSIQTGAAFDPATLATAVGIPDDLTWAVKWGAMADLLGRDGQARDPERAAFCEQRYRQAVEMAKILPVVVAADIAGDAVIPQSLQELDSGVPGWQGATGTPSRLGLAGSVLTAVQPVPNAVVTITLDVVRKANVPAADGTQLQLGREQLDAVLDYGEHLAAFKMGGAEFAATVRQADNFLRQALSYNRRTSALAKFDRAASDRSRDESYRRPRMVPGPGVGAIAGGAGA